MTPQIPTQPAATTPAQLESLVEARTRELSALSARLQELAEREKAQLARTLHDELGGLLTAAKMDLSWLQSRLDTASIQERLAQLGAVLDEAMDLKRRVVEELRPSLLDHFGLPTTLRTYFDAACAKANLEAEIQIAEEAQTLSRNAAIALFRVVQEGLNNVIRHAGAKRARLIVTADPQGLVLVLSDDGCGFDSTDIRLGESPGLAGMRQRVRTLGGQFAIDSAAGSGTRLKISVPA